MHTEKILDDLIKKTMNEIDPIELHRTSTIEGVFKEIGLRPWLKENSVLAGSDQDLRFAIEQDIQEKVHKLIKRK